MPMATSQPKNAAPTFEPPNRSRTPAATAATGSVGGSATGAFAHDGEPILLVLHSGHGALFPVTRAGNGGMGRWGEPRTKRKH